MTQSVSIDITPAGPAKWDLLGNDVQRLTGWSGDTMVYSYLECVKECTLQRTTLAAALARLRDGTSELFEGHLFDSDFDVRWVTEQDGRCRAWVTRETGSAGKQVRSQLKWYFLAGKYSGNDKATEGGEVRCWEDRYPGKDFWYPVPVGRQPREDDRCYIEVYEFAPVAPQPWPEDAAEVEQLLNQPAICAYRFAGVGFGKGEAPSDGAES